MRRPDERRIITKEEIEREERLAIIFPLISLIVAIIAFIVSG